MNTEQILANLDRLFSERKIREAEAFLDEQVRLALHTNNTSLLLTLYNEQEGIYRNTGRAGKAVDCGKKALELIEVLHLTGTRHHSVTLINTATALRMNHEPASSLSYYDAALGILQFEASSDSLLTATCLNNMSQAYLELGKDGEALRCLEKAYALINRLPDKKSESAITAVNIALTHLSLKRTEDAALYLEQAGSYYRTDAGTKDRHKGAWLSAMGEFHACSENRDKASAYFKQALNETLALFGENDACRRIRQAMKKYGLSSDLS